MGAVLCPNIRSLKNCDQSERDRAHSLVLSKIKSISLPQDTNKCEFLAFMKKSCQQRDSSD